jgi:hypothetical protein
MKDYGCATIEVGTPLMPYDAIDVSVPLPLSILND